MFMFTLLGQALQQLEIERRADLFMDINESKIPLYD